MREHADLLGIDWRKYRRRQSRRGLLARLDALDVDLETYGRLLEEDAGERERLVAAMRVTVTRFLRERPVWRALEQVVLPELLSRLEPGEPLRVWSAGCASGEEPYSIALLWRTLEPRLTWRHPLEILATDCDRQLLERARAGIYQAGTLRELPPDMLVHFESPDPSGASPRRLSAEIRRMVEFVPSDLLTDPPPPACHVVLCRYLALTYYRGARLAAVWRKLMAALVPGGALVVGRRESLQALPPEERVGLEPWTGAEDSIFRRRSAESEP